MTKAIRAYSLVVTLPPVPAGDGGASVPEKENNGKCAEKEEIDRTQGNYDLQGHKNRLNKAESGHARCSGVFVHGRCPATNIQK